MEEEQPRQRPPETRLGSGSKIRALALLSGGLDSSLAIRIMQEQGIDVVALNFYTGFCFVSPGRVTEFGIHPNSAEKAAEMLGIRLERVDISHEYLPILTKPRFGYGSAVNPCIDCRIAMLKKAKDQLSKENAGFIFTGEVLGQRPMTQMRNTLRLIEKQSGCEGILLRPLSAKLLPPTIPEKEGWVDRDRLYGISGRGRKKQMDLAGLYDLKEYPQPAGGCCVLTDKNYAKRLKDLFHHKKDQISLADAYLLKIGRHFRISEGLKVIVGRDERENHLLQSCREGRWSFTVLDFPGPTVLAEFDHDPALSELQMVASIAARYSDGKHLETLQVRCEDKSENLVLATKPMREEQISGWRID